jgi:hypothetical protein
MISSKKYGELYKLMNQNPLPEEKLDKFFDRLGEQGREDMIKIINNFNAEYLVLIDHAKNLELKRGVAQIDMATWKLWKVRTKRMMPTAIMISLAALYIAVKGFQSPIWTESILKAGVIMCGGFWVWQKMLGVAIIGAKKKFNKRRRNLIKKTKDFFRKYGIKDDGSIKIVDRLNRRDM